MQITDPIADMLTRIRNATAAHHTSVEVPASKIKLAIANILVEEGYVSSLEKIEDEKQGLLKLELKYSGRKSVITGLKRISKSGLRVYSDAEHMPRVLGGLGIAIVSTSKGLMTDKNARKNKIGGEVLAYVW